MKSKLTIFMLLCVVMLAGCASTTNVAEADVTDEIEYQIFLDKDHDLDLNEVLELRLSETIEQIEKVTTVDIDINDELSSVAVNIEVDEDEILADSVQVKIKDLVETCLEESSEYNIELIIK